MDQSGRSQKPGKRVLRVGARGEQRKQFQGAGTGVEQRPSRAGSTQQQRVAAQVAAGCSRLACMLDRQWKSRCAGRSRSNPGRTEYYKPALTRACSVTSPCTQPLSTTGSMLTLGPASMACRGGSGRTGSSGRSWRW